MMFKVIVNMKIRASTSVYRFMMTEDQITQKAATGITTEFAGCLSEKGKFFPDLILNWT